MPFKRYCTRCTKPIPDDRVLRSPFCSRECRAEDKRERRSARNERFCNKCGRSLRKPKRAEVTILVSHPKNCDVCGGTTWVNVDGSKQAKGGFKIPIVKRCPNWKVQKLQDTTPKTANDEGGLPSCVKSADGEPLPDGSDSFTLPPGLF